MADMLVDRDDVVTPAAQALPLDAVIHGDCLAVLRGLPDNSVDAMVTDPPYGLGTAPDMLNVLRAWLADEPYIPRGKGGFMGKAWDAFVPGPEYWRECWRVLKPGGHALVFAGTRTWDVMGLALRLAGFELRDTLQWLYGSGFPKSLDVSKAIDKAAGAQREVVGSIKCPNIQSGNYSQGKRKYETIEHPITAPATDAARQWDGWGTALKPAWEPVIVCRKPLAEKTVAANVLAHGTGALHIAASRVATADDLNGGQYSGGETINHQVYGTYYKTPGQFNQPAGRWPPNLLLSHSVFCREIGVSSVRTDTHYPARRGASHGISTDGMRGQEGLEERSPGSEIVTRWQCVPDCPVAELDRQSGVRASGLMKAGTQRSTDGGYMGHMPPVISNDTYGDMGGASRYFPTFRYVAKASRSERNRGCEEIEAQRKSNYAPHDPNENKLQTRLHGSVERRGNHHPTVKPLALMSWLITLITPPGGVVLDPFAGSGSTLVAAKMAGWQYLGIEREAAYVAIAEARLNAVVAGESATPELTLEDALEDALEPSVTPAVTPAVTPLAAVAPTPTIMPASPRKRRRASKPLPTITLFPEWVAQHTATLNASTEQEVAQ
jgi:site-specific DNA-methyltransferase (adenine-specific)